MMSKLVSIQKTVVIASFCFSGAALTYASTDYAPALWDPAYSGHWYTSGYGHKFCVVHTCEGYYYGTISYLKNSSTSTSVHYVLNSDHNSDGAEPGELTQMVRESYYAWHARCWNQYSFGAEHEGFVSNPAWYTEAMYQSSAEMNRHLCEEWNITKDRNHIVGHNAKSSSSWCTYAEAHFGIDAHCNTHSDPGAYWDWSHYMNLVNPPAPVTSKPAAPLRFKMDVNGDGKLDLAMIWDNDGTAYARACLSTGAVYAITSDSSAGVSFGNLDVDRQWIPMDVNGDGKTDLVLIYNYNGDAKVRIGISNGSRFTFSTGNTLAGTFGTLGVDRWWSKGDVNNDGKDDIILIWENDGSAIGRVCLSSGSNFSITSDTTLAGSFGTLNVDRQWIPMDYNGDGKEDLVMIWNNAGVAKARICPSSGTAFSLGADSTIAGDFCTLGVDRFYLKGDVNGDGKKDIIMIWKRDGEAVARMCSSTGSGFTIGSDSVLAGSFGTLNLDRLWIPMDANGDGKDDLVMIWNKLGEGNARTCLSSGSSFTLGPDSVVCGSFGTLNVNRLYLVGDINGDGKQDLAMIWNKAGEGKARMLPSSGTGFSIGTDGGVCGTFGTLGADRLWLPPGM